MRSLACLFAIGAVLALPAEALAQSSKLAYGNVPGAPPAGGPTPTGGAPTPTAGGPAPTAARPSPSAPVTTRGQLPFTGLDLGAVALAGVVLVMAGVLIRRVTTAQTRDG